jgi:hypothetical protein
VSLGDISEKQVQQWKSDSKVDAAKSTHKLLFGADCDVDVYMSSPGMSALSRNALLELNGIVVKWAELSLRQTGLEATESASKHIKKAVETIPSEEHGSDRHGMEKRNLQVSTLVIPEESAALIQRDVIVPKMIPKPNVPSIPKPNVPNIPSIPEPNVPNIPSIPKPNVPNIPSIPSIPGIGDALEGVTGFFEGVGGTLRDVFGNIGDFFTGIFGSFEGLLGFLSGLLPIIGIVIAFIAIVYVINWVRFVYSAGKFVAGGVGGITKGVGITKGIAASLTGSSGDEASGSHKLTQRRGMASSRRASTRGGSSRRVGPKRRGQGSTRGSARRGSTRGSARKARR